MEYRIDIRCIVDRPELQLVSFIADVRNNTTTAVVHAVTSAAWE